MGAARRVVKLDLENMKLSSTAALFEGKERAGIDITLRTASETSATFPSWW